MTGFVDDHGIGQEDQVVIHIHDTPKEHGTTRLLSRFTTTTKVSLWKQDS